MVTANRVAMVTANGVAMVTAGRRWRALPPKHQRQAHLLVMSLNVVK